MWLLVIKWPESYQPLDLGSATSVLELWLSKNSEPRLNYKQKFV